MALKVNQLVEEYAYACLLNGRPAETVIPTATWFKRWEEEYGLSMRQANRKYEVPRKIQKERLDIFWVTLFRIRKFILLNFGYDPLICNWDQSPFHHNETGAQDKPTLCVRADKVPVVQGNSDSKARWTANLWTQNKFTEEQMKTKELTRAECMFKAEKDGTVSARLKAFLRSRGIHGWFTSTVGPKGSYREDDIISFLQKHLDPWMDGRDWRIILADDYSAHKSRNVWNLCWNHGYILLIHGGGCTPVGQTVDTDLNQHVRRLYGGKEARLLIEKMRSGDVVPKLAHEECMMLMLDVLMDSRLHTDAAEGYKRVGQSVALDGSEDIFICREAGVFWREPTVDGYPSMRPKIDDELAAVAEEFESTGLVWSQAAVQNLILPYPPRRKADAILAKLGEDFYHDDVHALDVGEGITLEYFFIVLRAWKFEGLNN
jgi:hypothetical protein